MPEKCGKTGIPYSVQNKISPRVLQDLQRSYTCRYNSGSGALYAAITEVANYTQTVILVIAACRAPLPHTFKADFTLTVLALKNTLPQNLEIKKSSLPSDFSLLIQKKFIL
jgi:hypothetical protein